MVNMVGRISRTLANNVSSTIDVAIRVKFIFWVVAPNQFAGILRSGLWKIGDVGRSVPRTWMIDQ